MSSCSLSVAAVKAELRLLRQRQGLAHPAAVLQLSPALRARLADGRAASEDTATQVISIVAALRRSVEALGPHERLHAGVDLNLIPEHSYPTLTERQESLAQLRRCAAKTVRRNADKALDTLALLLVTSDHAHLTPPDQAVLAPPTSGTADSRNWPEGLRRFWALSAGSRVDIVCSEIPPDERPDFASPTDRNYLRYAKFADLDSLIYLRTRLAQLSPSVTIRDFSPSEYYDTDADSLIVVGGPPWNAKFREFLPQLPFYFEPHPLGEDDPLVVPAVPGLKLGPRWTQRHELLDDLAVFTRLTLGQGTTVFLLGGCLTLGVLGAAMCFLQGERGIRNAARLTEMVGSDDFVLVTEARRVGGITDTADLAITEPLLVLSRRHTDPFTVIVNNSDRDSSI